MSSTPRAKPMGGGKEAPSPRAAKPAGDSKKPKVKKPKASSAPAAPMEMDIKAGNTQELSEADAKSQLAELQKKYGALVVSFNNQQSELAISQKYSMQLEEEVSRLKAETEGKSDQALSSTKSELENAMAVRAATRRPSWRDSRRRRRPQAKGRLVVITGPWAGREARLTAWSPHCRPRCLSSVRQPSVAWLPGPALSPLLLACAGLARAGDAEHGAAKEDQQASGGECVGRGGGSTLPRSGGASRSRMPAYCVRVHIYAICTRGGARSARPFTRYSAPHAKTHATHSKCRVSASQCTRGLLFYRMTVVAPVQPPQQSHAPSSRARRVQTHAQGLMSPLCKV